MKNIYLIGFMGAGKSTVGRALKKELSWELLDTDLCIVNKMQMSIPEIFEKYGEERFRQIETEVLKEIASCENQIIACGGGVAMRQENVEIMKENGTIFLLDVSPQTILKRVRNDDNRPLLNGRKNIEGITELMNERMPKYTKAADIVIKTDGKNSSIVAKEIAKYVNSLKGDID